MERAAAKNENISKTYTWTRPAKPSQTVTLNSYDDVNQVLNERHFLSSYNERLLNITKEAVVVSLHLLFRSQAVFIDTTLAKRHGRDRGDL